MARGNRKNNAKRQAKYKRHLDGNVAYQHKRNRIKRWTKRLKEETKDKILKQFEGQWNKKKSVAKGK